MSTPDQQPPVGLEAASQAAARGIRHRLATAERSTVVSILVVAYLFAASVAWAMTTPIGGVPDEPAHITYSAAVVRGDLGALAAVNHPYYTQLAVVTVPAWVASMTDPPRSVDAFPFPCFGGAVELTANCAPTMSHSTEPVEVPTTVTRYPPPYYWIVGLPTLAMTGGPAVYAMRIVSAALAAGMIALGLTVASPSRRTWLALGAAVAFTPMVGHLAGSVNPSGLEITAAMGLGIGLMGVDGTRRRGHGMTAALVVVLAFALAWARPNTHLTLIAVVGASGLINPRGLLDWFRRRVVWITVTAGTVLAIGSALAFRSLGTNLTAAAVAPRSSVAIDSALYGPLYGLQGNLHELERRFIDWGQHLIGRFGWLDHSPPVAITVAWSLVVLALVMLALARAPRRQGAALLTVAVGALVLAPLFVISNSLNAGIYQARYHLALATLIVIAAITLLSRLPKHDHQRLGWSMLRRFAIFAPAATVLTILGSLHRYSVGGDPHLTDALWLPFASRAWMPPTPAVLIAVLAAIGALVSARLLAVHTADAENQSPESVPTAAIETLS